MNIDDPISTFGGETDTAHTGADSYHTHHEEPSLSDSTQGEFGQLHFRGGDAEGMEATEASDNETDTSQDAPEMTNEEILKHAIFGVDGPVVEPRIFEKNENNPTTETRETHPQNENPAPVQPTFTAAQHTKKECDAKISEYENKVDYQKAQIDAAKRKMNGAKPGSALEREAISQMKEAQARLAAEKKNVNYWEVEKSFAPKSK